MGRHVQSLGASEKHEVSSVSLGQHKEEITRLAASRYQSCLEAAMKTAMKDAVLGMASGSH